MCFFMLVVALNIPLDHASTQNSVLPVEVGHLAAVTATESGGCSEHDGEGF